MDGSMAYGVEQLAIGDEIISMVKKFMCGVVFSYQIARDLMYKVGPGCEFLSKDHTAENFKNELWSSCIFTRQPINVWREDGEKDTIKRTREKFIVSWKHTRRSACRMRLLKIWNVLNPKVRGSW